MNEFIFQDEHLSNFLIDGDLETTLQLEGARITSEQGVQAPPVNKMTVDTPDTLLETKYGCACCGVQLNGPKQLDDHLGGKRHRKCVRKYQ